LRQLEDDPRLRVAAESGLFSQVSRPVQAPDTAPGEPIISSTDPPLDVGGVLVRPVGGAWVHYVITVVDQDVVEAEYLYAIPSTPPGMDDILQVARSAIPDGIWRYIRSSAQRRATAGLEEVEQAQAAAIAAVEVWRREVRRVVADVATVPPAAGVGVILDAAVPGLHTVAAALVEARVPVAVVQPDAAEQAVLQRLLPEILVTAGVEEAVRRLGVPQPLWITTMAVGETVVPSVQVSTMLEALTILEQRGLLPVVNFILILPRSFG